MAVHVITKVDPAAGQESGSVTDVAEEKPTDSTATEPNGEREYITGARLLAVIASVTVVGFLMLLDMSIIATAIPPITKEFQSIEDVGWYGSSFNLASAALQPLTGKIYTHFKAKWTFITFLAIFALGSLICGVAPSSGALIAGRAVAGIGVSGLQNGAMTIITNAVPFQKRPALLGILLGCSQLGLITGPLIGGAIAEYSTWRWCFYINLPVAAVVSVILALIHIPERALQHDKSVIQTVLSDLDLTGFAIFAPGAVMFLLGLEFGGRKHPWDSATVIGLIVGGIATLALFIGWEYRQGSKAMFPLTMLKKREVWTSMLASTFLMGGSVLPSSFYLPIYFQAVKAASPFMSGLYVLPNILAVTLFAVLSGTLLKKTRYYVPWVLLAGSSAAIASGLLTTLSPSTPTAQWVGYQILFGIRGASIQMPLVAIQMVLAEEQLSVAMALLVFSQTFGGAVFLTISQTIFTNSLRSQLSETLSPAVVLRVMGAGARDLYSIVSGADLDAVLQAYSTAVDRVFYLPLAASIGLFMAGWGMGWHDISKKGISTGPPIPRDPES